MAAREGASEAVSLSVVPTQTTLWPCREADRGTEFAIRFLRRLPYREYLRTAHWERVRTLALARAHHAGALRPAIHRLEVHHRSYARKGFEQPEDVVVLCDACHTRHHATIQMAAVRAMDHPPLKIDLLRASDRQWRQRA